MARRGNGGVVGKLNIPENNTAKGVWTSQEQFNIKENAGVTRTPGWPIGPGLSIYGYAMGGGDPMTTTTDRVTFSTSVTAASTISNLSQARGYLATISDCVNYGYGMGGFTNISVATTDRITFNTSVTAARTASNLTVTKHGPLGISDKVTYGYAVGGYNSSGAGYIATTDRITFSTGSVAASTVSNASVARYYGAGVSDAFTYGYAMGGASPTALLSTDRITFSTSVTAASTVSNLSQARHLCTGLSDGAIYGYTSGGLTSGNNLPPQSAVTDRIAFSTSVTAASTVSNITTLGAGMSGMSDGSLYGYWLSSSLANRITFSTGVTAASTASQLSLARYYSAGLSDGAV
jgi:hypothetical protein